MLYLGWAPSAAPQQPPPDPLQRHFEAAQTFQLVGDLDRAESEYQQALARALQRMGNLRAAQGHFDEAVALLESATEARQDYLDARADLAIALLRKGEMVQAAKEAQAVLARDAKHARAQLLLGKVRFLQGNPEAAVTELRAALQLEGDFEGAYLLSLAYLKQQKLSEAILLFDEMQAALKPSAGLHVLFGRAYREGGYYDQAINEFRKAIALDARHPRAHYYLGITQLLQGGGDRFAEARRLFQEELKIQPDDYFSRLYLGVVELQERNFAAAEEQLKIAGRLQPENPDPLFYLGQIYATTDRPGEAAQMLEKSIRLTRDMRHNDYQVTRAHLLLGQSLVKLGRREEGQTHIQRSQALRDEALRMDRQSLQQGSEAPAGPHRELAVLDQGFEPQRLDSPVAELAQEETAETNAGGLTDILANTYHNLGVIRARREQFAEAAGLFQQAARWQPALEGLDRNWGMASFRAGRFADAVAPFERHLSRDAGDAQARQLLALSYFAQENHAKTVETLRPVMGQLPDDPKLLIALATSFVRIGETYNGERIFARLIEEHSEVAEVQLMMAQAHAAQGQTAEALARFRRALELDPRTARAHYFSGLILLRQGKLEEAAAEFREELRLNAADATAKYHLAYVLLLQQQTGEAVVLLQEVVRGNPTYADAHYQLGKALLQQGKVKDAIPSLEAAVQLDPESDYSHFQLSQAYRRDGRSEDAERELSIYRQLKEKGRRPAEP